MARFWADGFWANGFWASGFWAGLTSASVTITTTSLPTGYNGVPYAETISATGGATPYSFAVTAGSLPTGLSLSSAGALTGTPSAIGTFNFTVTVTDADLETDDQAFTVMMTVVEDVSDAAVIELRAQYGRPLKQDIIGNEWFTAEDRRLAFTVTADGTTPQDITGWSLSWVLKAKRTGTALITKTTEATSITLETPLSGRCVVGVGDTDIADLVGEKKYYHELKRTDAGHETVLAYGVVVLGQSLHG